MVAPPKPTKGSEQSHSVSSGTVPDPQFPKRNIQLAGTRLPSTLNGGTRKSQLLLEGPCRDKDSEGLKPPADMEPQNNPVTDLSGTGAKYQVDETESTRLWYRSLAENKGNTSSKVEPDIKPLQLQTFADVQAFLLFEDEMAQESDDEEVFEAEEDMEEDTQAEEEQHQSPPPNTDKSKPYPDQETQESESDTSSPELKKYDNILPLTERQLVKYLRKNLDHKEQSDKVIDASMNSIDKNIIARGDLINALNEVTKTLKAIQDVVKEDHNVTHADTKEPPSHIEGEHVTIEDDAEKPEPPLTDPTLEIPVPQREGKGIATDEQLESTKKLVPASKVVREDP
ncbi:hypothetical protein Tco_1449497 [Tanacetum coccineum]